MPKKYAPRFGIHIDRLYPGQWQVGMFLNYDECETYLYFYFFKWSISIGLLSE